MAAETFAERFKRLTAGYDDADLMKATGMSKTAIDDLRNGNTQSMKLPSALGLCRLLGISPWELQGEREPAASSQALSIGASALIVERETVPDEVSRYRAETGATTPPADLRQSLEDALAQIRTEYRQQIADTNRALEKAVTGLRRELQELKPARARKRKSS